MQRQATLKLLRRYQEGSYDSRLVEEEYEEMEYTYSEWVYTNRKVKENECDNRSIY